MAMPTPYQAFAKSFSSYQSQHAGPSSSSHLDSPLRRDAVLDETNGLIRNLADALEEQLQSSSSSSTWDGVPNDPVLAETRDALLNEHRTWQLVRAVYENRLGREAPDFAPLGAEVLLQKCPYASPEEVAQAIVEEDPELSLWAALIEHLQSRPLFTTAPPLEARHGYLPSTIRRAQTGRIPKSASLDPDFSLRDPHGPGLAGEDQTYQQPLLATLWDLVRHGELDAAVTVCEQAGEPWRGATLLGGRRWGMGGMTPDSAPDPPVGNRRRALWKKSCKAIAKNPTLSEGERALYAALVCDLGTLLPACETWEDHLWAHVQHRLEARLEAKWHELGGFWEEESRTLGDSNEGESIPSTGLEDVFNSIIQSPKETVKSAVQSPYYVAQMMIILGRHEDLLNQMAAQVPRMEETYAPELVAQSIRFFAHLVLLLRTLGQIVPDEAANTIIQAYLRILEREGNDELVAMYAACLREGNGEESYARFLRSMDPNASVQDRAEALQRAQQHSLDVAIIARETVRLILAESFATIPALSAETPDITELGSGLTERDVYLIRSIEWLTMVPATSEDALRVSNDVGRYFLALGHAAAAQALLKSLPADIAATDAMDDDADDDFQRLEHEQIRQLFVVFACHELVGEVLGRQPKHTATKLEQHSWRKSLNTALDKVHRATIDLLTGDWLRFPLPPNSPRGRELRRIRQIFIPDLVLRLHDLLFAHREAFPRLLQQAMDLTKIVADEDNHIYEEFLGPSRVTGKSGRGGATTGAEKLVVYLEKIREAGLAMLQSGSESAFELPGGTVTTGHVDA